MRWPWQKKQSTAEILRDLFINPGKSGVTVNWKTALECSTSFACAHVISEDIAKVPFKLFKSKEEGGKSPAKEHYLYDLLHRQPNDWQTSFEFREQIGLHLSFAGNAYVFKNIVNEKIVELLPYEPGSVKAKQNSDFSLSYELTLNDGKKVTVPQENMWHLRGPSWNGWMGLEGVKLAREAIGLSLATEEHEARLFSNGARVGGVLTTDQKLTEDQVKKIRESWQSTQGGNENAHRTAIVWGGLKYTQSALSSVDAQTIETRKQQIEEICRFWRVMPIMIGHSDKTATYASSEQMFLAHVVHTMTSWYERLEQSADVNLLSKDERKEGYYTKFIVNGLLRGSHKDRADYYTKMYSIASINPNEIRELEDMNPYEGGEEYRAPLNMEDPSQPNNDETETENDG